MVRVLGTDERSYNEMDTGEWGLRLGGRNEDVAVLRGAQVGQHAHKGVGFRSCLLGLRHVQIHFVPVEIRVVRVADALVETQRPAPATPRDSGKAAACWARDAAGWMDGCQRHSRKSRVARCGLDHRCEVKLPLVCYMGHKVMECQKAYTTRAAFTCCSWGNSVSRPVAEYGRDLSSSLTWTGRPALCGP